MWRGILPLKKPAFVCIAFSLQLHANKIGAGDGKDPTLEKFVDRLAKP